MDWFQSSKNYREHKQHTRRAIVEYRVNHPGSKVDITRAQEEYALSLGLPADYFLLGKLRRPVTKQRLKDRFDWMPVYCPECGAPLDWEFLPGCKAANPKRYTGVFLCTGDDCLYHVIVQDGIIDIFNKITDGKFDTIKMFRGRI